MADRIVEGLWDCPYCGSKAIGGLTKHCPNCGHPQDADTTFYLGEKKKYLEDEIAKEYGKGADWHCEYCGSLNRVHYKYCVNCGAPKEESKNDYFTAKKTKEPVRNSQPVPANKQNKKKRLFPVPLLLILFAFFVFVGVLNKPKNAAVRITDKSWVRSIDVEEWRTVKEKDWNVPDGGRVYDQKREIHHYQDVLDHYEQRSRQVSEQVLDGYDTHTSYSNNGDGTFSEHTYSTPRYRTVTKTEYYQAPVYRQEPVYQTRYYYEIERWIPERTETSEGGDEDPYWPELNLTDSEREADRQEVYRFMAENVKKEKTYDLELPFAQWKELSVGEELDVTYKGDRVTKINGISVADSVS